MYQSEFTIRVRYSETDRMDYVYYGNYAQYFEVARVEALRSLGISYKQMEDEGILLPVLDYKIKFIKPGVYDDVLTIKTTIPSLPSAKILFTYETFNSSGQLINVGESTLFFLNKNTKRPCAAPQHVMEALKKFF